MKQHIEYDDFGEYVEMYDGSDLIVAEDLCTGSTIELILFEENP